MKNFERFMEKHAIRNLSLVLIICYAFGYMIELVNNSFIYYLTLNPYAILHGQVWRLLTWLIIPPPTGNLFYMLIMLLFYYSIGTALERTWGTVRYNIYILTGILLTIAGAFLMMGYTYLAHRVALDTFGIENFFKFSSTYFSTYYVNMSIFLAYAATFPDAVVLLMFILPVKVKWLGIAYAALLGYELVSAVTGGMYYAGFAILASLANFIIFFVRSRRNTLHRLSPKEVRRRNEFRRAVNEGKREGLREHRTAGSGRAAIHRCCICGRTEADGEDLEFRYCSKCAGNFEFCRDHLFSHEHAQPGGVPKMMSYTGSQQAAADAGKQQEGPDHE